MCPVQSHVPSADYFPFHHLPLPSIPRTHILELPASCTTSGGTSKPLAIVYRTHVTSGSILPVAFWHTWPSQPKVGHTTRVHPLNTNPRHVHSWQHNTFQHLQETVLLYIPKPLSTFSLYSGLMQHKCDHSLFFQLLGVPRTYPTPLTVHFHFIPT